MNEILKNIYFFILKPVKFFVFFTATIISNRFVYYNSCNFVLGCRSSAVNLEGRGLGGWISTRHCVLAKLTDLTVENFLDVRARAGALLLLMPSNMANLTEAEREVILLNLHLELIFIFY